VKISIEIEGDRMTARQGRQVLFEAPLERMIAALSGALEQHGVGILPSGARLWRMRRDAVACALEIPPHARTVLWIAPDSRAPFGPGARYQTRFLAFPYLVLLLVLRGGELTGYQQLYYRTAPLDDGEDLLLPNLLNVARGYEQRCWLCLQHLPRVGRLPWPRKLAAVTEHMFAAAFNRSAEMHEGNSYWSEGRPADPRVATLDAWEAASRKDRRFALDVAWRPAGVTASEELGAMLDRVVAPLRARTAADLVGVIQSAGGE